MAILLSIAGLLVILFFLGRTYYLNSFNRNVNLLFRNAELRMEETFEPGKIKDLPEPVRKYFENVLKPGQTYISFVRLKHTGKFRTDPDRDWMDLEGEQYFTSDKPGFVWRGKTKMFNAVDKYYSDKGGLQVQLLGVLPIVNAEGDNYNQSELLRWLGESPWFPTNLLPREGLKWKEASNNKARLEFGYKGISIYYDVTFNEKNEIAEIETERYKDAEKKEKWRGRFYDYIEVNDVKIPSRIEGMWVIDGEEKSYAKFNVSVIEFDIPAKF